MAKKRKKSIMIVSPTGKPIRVFPVTFLVIFLFFLFVVGGVSAYFIPSEMFRLKSADQNRRRNLSEQNFLLQERIHSSEQMLNHVKEQILRLEAKKEKVSALTGVDENVSRKPSQARLRRHEGYAAREPHEECLLRVRRLDSVFTAFSMISESKEHPLVKIPVSKPVSGNFIISQRFGPSKDPFTGKQKWHYGVDFAATPGTPVVATASGRISRADNSSVWGRRLVIEHGDGIITLYAHLGTVRVAKGSKVRRGDVVGTIGCSGLTTGPHVHYEIWRNGNVVDPETYFFPSGSVCQLKK